MAMMMIMMIICEEVEEVLTEENLLEEV